ncbi:MAG: hypothetical protein H7Z41_00045 [Cytophagales bacterium]|nr:hypothetical protein [Armatimonadota bacterium]
MYDRELGCKTVGCFLGMVVVLAFFAVLQHTARDFAEQVKQSNPSNPSSSPGVPTDATGSRDRSTESEGEEADDAMTVDVTNAARLPLILNAMRRYADDHDGLLPPMDSPESLRAALHPGYLPGLAVFGSPHRDLPYLPNPALSGKPVNSFARPAETIAVFEPRWGTETQVQTRRAAVFLDGTCRSFTLPEWETLRQKAHLSSEPSPALRGGTIQ